MQTVTVGLLKYFFLKFLILKKNQQPTKRREKLPSVQVVKCAFKGSVSLVILAPLLFGNRHLVCQRETKVFSSAEKRV